MATSQYLQLRYTRTCYSCDTYLLQLRVEMPLLAQQLFDLALQSLVVVLQLGDVTAQLPLLDVAPTTTRRLANNDRCAIKSLLCIDS